MRFDILDGEACVQDEKNYFYIEVIILMSLKLPRPHLPHEVGTIPNSRVLLMLIAARMKQCLAMLDKNDIQMPKSSPL